MRRHADECCFPADRNDRLSVHHILDPFVQAMQKPAVWDILEIHRTMEEGVHKACREAQKGYRCIGRKNLSVPDERR